MRFCCILLVTAVFVTGTANSMVTDSEQIKTSSVASTDVVHATDNARLLRTQDDADGEEERAFNFKSLTKNLKGLFKSKPKLTKQEIPMPSANELRLMKEGRKDISFKYFKIWDEIGLSKATVETIVKKRGIADDFLWYKQVAIQGRTNG